MAVIHSSTDNCNRRMHVSLFLRKWLAVAHRKANDIWNVGLVPNLHSVAPQDGYRDGMPKAVIVGECLFRDPHEQTHTRSIANGSNTTLISEQHCIYRISDPD
jgi:hypothetical protein